jgi:hypothetical protein
LIKFNLHNFNLLKTFRGVAAFSILPMAALDYLALWDMDSSMAAKGGTLLAALF